MRLVTRDEMKQLEAEAQSRFGLSTLVMMELAGKALADHCLAFAKPGDKVCIVAGKGNNGGDGLVAARHLINANRRISLHLMGDPEDYRGDAAVNWHILENMGVTGHRFEDDCGSDRLRRILGESACAIDALYGTGFHGEMQEGSRNVVGLLNESSVYLISADLPSGLDADTGWHGDAVIRADLTLTFGLPKIGLVQGDGPDCAGEIHVASIGIPRSWQEDGARVKLILPQRLPKRHFGGHKGDYGHVLVVGGALGMTGAAVMAAQGALRIGAGLTTIAVPKESLPVAAGMIREAMTFGLDDDPIRASGQVLSRFSGVRCVVIGPGLGREADKKALLRRLAGGVECPVVLDADALYHLADLFYGDSDWLARLEHPVVITPHPGEMARLSGLKISEIVRHPLEIAKEYAVKWGTIVVLKGARTVVASPDGRAWINRTGNPGMATGGTGDVLAGMIAGLAAQRFDLLDAAILAVGFHGRAGDLAGKQLGEYAMTAGDLIDQIPNALLNPGTDPLQNDE